MSEVPQMSGKPQKTDAELKKAVLLELSWLPSIDSSHIGVTADDGAITLTGQVGSYPEKVAAGNAALRVSGVRALAQEIAVHTTWTARTDTDIAREASEALERAINVPDTIKVSVAGRVITLTGDATWHYQSDAAAWAVHTIKGVIEVEDRVVIRPIVATSTVKASIQAALVRNAHFESSHISVMTDSGGRITLEGIVRSPGERRQAELVAWSSPGITAITNNLTIQY